MINGELAWGSWGNLEQRGRIKKTSPFPGIKGAEQNLSYIFKEHPPKTKVNL